MDYGHEDKINPTELWNVLVSFVSIKRLFPVPRFKVFTHLKPNVHLILQQFSTTDPWAHFEATDAVLMSFDNSKPWL